MEDKMINSARLKVNTFFRISFALCVLCVAFAGIFLAVDETNAKSSLVTSDTGYVRYATGINIYGNPQDWYALASYYGYELSDKPVRGGVVSFQKGAYGTNATYGFLGVVLYYQDSGNYWDFGVRYAFPTAGQTIYFNHAPAHEQSFHVLKNDTNVHYIYRRGENVKADAYYFYPQYTGYDIVGEGQDFSPTSDGITVYPEKLFARAYLRSGKPVRILARAEVGQTLWVFVKAPGHSRDTYARTYSKGKEKWFRFDAYSDDAYRMYYTSNYGDTVLDLGYVDYSKIAGSNGEVIVTIKKGNKPDQLVTLQTIKLGFGKY